MKLYVYLSFSLFLKGILCVTFETNFSQESRPKGREGGWKGERETETEGETEMERQREYRDTKRELFAGVMIERSLVELRIIREQRRNLSFE